MSEEIKEILEIFKKINEEYSVDTELDFEDYEIPNIYLKQFLDYITNLQEENIRLKELCDKYEEEHNTTFQIWKYNKDTYKEENERLNNIIDELEKWLNEYYESNRKWYNTELSNHDRKYYEREYRNTEFMIVKFKKQLNELKGDNK